MRTLKSLAAPALGLLQFIIGQTLAARIESAVVTLTSGTYIGKLVNPTSPTPQVLQYLGLPFATPPVGPLRFAPPLAVPSSNGSRLADKQSPRCIQNSSSRQVTSDESEDCLYLNIFRPATAPPSPRAVMVWLYGGGLQSGAASQEIYDGSVLAANGDVVVVSPNYRLNAFGFPGEHAAIPARERNLGLLDQRMTLQWVQQNIAKFSGDPQRITLFGESAGARSADFHLLTMGENATFRAVIMQSGSAELTPLADKQRADDSLKKGHAFSQLAEAVGCKDEPNLILCMRKLPVGRLKDAIVSKKLYFGSSDDDGQTTVQDQAAIRQLRKAADAVLFIGTNAHEMKSSIYRNYRNTSLSAYISTVFPQNSSLPIDEALRSRLLETYTSGPGTAFANDLEAISTFATELSFTCLTSREARISGENGYLTFRYLFNASFPNTEHCPGCGAHHGAEIPYIFGNLPRDATVEQKKLSRTMMKMWTDFAKNPEEGLRFKNVIAEPGYMRMGFFFEDGGFYGGTNHEVDQRCDVFEKLYEGRA